jgi:hypothetical protein
MNRADRRRAAKEAGLDWRANQRASRAASRVEAACLAMPASEARRILAEWAAVPGRTQAEVDAMNARGADVG